MESSVITINGIKVTEYRPAVTTNKTILFFHGTGGATNDEGLKQYCKTNDTGAWTYCPSYSGGWVNIATMIAIVDYICNKHNIPKIKLMTGLSAGGNCTYTYLTQTKNGHNKVEVFAPIAINSRQFMDNAKDALGQPVIHYHGENDTPNNVLSESEGFITEYDKLFPGQAKRVVFSNKGHNVWDTVYASLLDTPTEPGGPPLYAPFDQSLYDWAGITGDGQPPIEPPVEPVKDPIIESYVLEGAVYHKTQSGVIYTSDAFYPSE